MTGWLDVSDADPRIGYDVGPAQTTFVVPFLFFDATDLDVFVNGVQMTLGVDYTVSGALNTAGGVITFLTAQAGVTVIIQRAVPIELLTHIPPSGPLDVPAVNFQFSKLVAMLQQIDRRHLRAILQPDSDVADIASLPAKAARAGQFLAFDSNGDPVAAATLPAATVVTAFMVTLLDDPDAVTARATLGLTSTMLAVGALQHATAGGLT